MKIIVAEDNKSTARLLKTILTHHNHEVITVANGFQLLDYLQNNKDITVVITDLNMPTLDGISAANIIKLHLNPDLPIIGITGITENKINEEALLKLFIKPINLTELLNTLD